MPITRSTVEADKITEYRFTRQPGRTMLKNIPCNTQLTVKAVVFFEDEDTQKDLVSFDTDEYGIVVSQSPSAIRELKSILEVYPDGNFTCFKREEASRNNRTYMYLEL